MELPSGYGNGCSVTKTREIVICTRCNGTGDIRVDTDDPGYEGPWWKLCPQCNGSGRRQRMVTTEYLPFADAPRH